MAEEEKKSGGKNTGMAIVAYIIFFVPLLVEGAKNDPFVKYHVKQGLALLLLSVAVSILGSIIPFIGWFIILPVGSIFVLVLLIMGIVNAVNGVEKPLPVIGSIGENFKF